MNNIETYTRLDDFKTQAITFIMATSYFLNIKDVQKDLEPIVADILSAKSLKDLQNILHFQDNIDNEDPRSFYNISAKYLKRADTHTIGIVSNHGLSELLNLNDFYDLISIMDDFIDEDEDR